MTVDDCVDNVMPVIGLWEVGGSLQTLTGWQVFLELLPSGAMEKVYKLRSSTLPKFSYLYECVPGHK